MPTTKDTTNNSDDFQEDMPQVEMQSLSECSSGDLDSELDSDIESEYPDDIRLLADTLISSQGEVIADVLAGLRDTLDGMKETMDKIAKILYNKM